MDDVTPMVGPVYGWRIWEIDDGRGSSSWTEPDRPPALKSRGGRWEDATQQARCLDDANSLLAAYMRTIMDPHERQRRSRDHEPVTSRRCWCGLYAHTTLGRCFDANEPALLPHRPGVLGLVSASGRMIAADRGFRAQTMTVDTLVCLREFRHQPHVHAIARSLGVPVACVRNKGSRAAMRRRFERAFAHRDGVYLWEREAPWTSDVTSESSTSLTSPTPQGVNRSGLGIPWTPTYAPPLWSSGSAMTWLESDDDEAGEERADG